MTKFIKTNLTSIFIVAIITLVFLTIYVAVQQDIRQTAYDPQIQGAEDVAMDLSAGATPQQIVSPNNPVDMSKSLDPFIIIFDGSNHELISSVQLGGSTPTPPVGTFAYAKQHGEDRFTWQVGNIRDAAVLVYSAGNTPYFVMVARSLREVDTRINIELEIIAAAWLVTLIFYAGFKVSKHYLYKQTA